jgi:hypothetical protein
MPFRFQLLNSDQEHIPAITGAYVAPSTSKAVGATPSRPRTGYTYPWNALYRDSRRPLTRQSHASFPHPQADMNLYRNRIPSTIPFPRQASDLTRYHVPLRSMLKCEDNMVCWGMVVLRKDRGNHAVSPQSPFASAGPNLRSGTLGTTHRHVTGPQVVPQCSLQEQPSVHAITISHRFSSTRERTAQSLQTYLPLKKSCSCMPKSDIGTNNFLQKNILTRFFVPDSHQWRGESGMSGHQHGRNASGVDKLRVLAGRRRTERTSEGARRSRLPQMGISIMPVTDHEKI